MDSGDFLIYGDLLLENFDDLLDFSTDDTQQGTCLPPPPPPPDQQPPIPAVSNDDAAIAAISNDDSSSFFCDEFDLAEMEWLSNFVEESFSLAGIEDVNSALSRAPPAANNGNVVNSGDGDFRRVVVGNEEEELLYFTDSPLSVLENDVGAFLVGSGISSAYSSTSPSPASSSCSAAAPRNKRARTPVLPHPSSADSKPTPILPPPTGDPLPGLEKKKKLKIKLTPPAQPAPAAIQEGEARKCLHCGIQKTPQWRAGPMGPKTLCNACGVRYKSGRLFPEYRPAASPTFVASVHSNSHKKVVEMRMRCSEDDEAEAERRPPAKQVSSKCCELLNYIRGDRKEWGAQEGRKERGLLL